MSAQRRWANDRAFQIGVHVLRGLLTPVDAARPLSDIADASLCALTPAVASAFASRHGPHPRRARRGWWPSARSAAVK